MVQTMSQFATIVREVSLDAVAGDAQQPPRLLCVAAPGEGRQLTSTLLGPECDYFMSVADTPPSDSAAAFEAALLVWSGTNASALRAHIATARQHGWPVLVVSTTLAPPPADFTGLHITGWPADPEVSIDDARTALVHVIDEERWPALGRYLPTMRQATARELVLATARVNAQFSGLSAAAGLLPLLGTLLSVGGDFLVLTKNQVLMLFKLAAIHGRDLDDRKKIYLEMGSVVGAGLAWRTIARSVLGAIPGPVGMIPRVGIAYGGTLAIGMAAHYYYHEGRLPTGHDLRTLAQRATDWVQQHRPGATAALPPTTGTIAVHEEPMPVPAQRRTS